MKRPLLAVCALVVCLIALWQALFPPDLADHAMAGQKVYIYGQVASKQYRTSYGRRSSILYLSNVTICPKEAVDHKLKTLSESLNHPVSWDIFSKQILENFIESVVAERGATEQGAERCGATEQGKVERRATEQGIADNAGLAVSEDSYGKFNSQIMVYLDGEEPAIGSYVLVEGMISDFDLPRNPGEFNSRLYYATLGVGVRMYDAELIWKSQEYSHVREFMWKLKCSWSSILEERLGKEQGSVLSTILFGSKDRLDVGMKDLYQQSGISHILAISGLHMSLVGMSLYKLLRRVGVPLWASSLLGVLIILTYGVFTGAGASAYRAAGMFVIRMLGVLLEKTYDMLTSLGVLLLMMVLQNPLYLYHSGFLLSFGAMVGIGCVFPLLAGAKNSGRYREGWRKVVYEKWSGVKQALLVSFSVTVATLPIMVLNFYEIAPYSMALNLLILPLLPLLFVLGITLVIVSAWDISTIICALTRLVLNWYSWLAEGSLSLPGSRCIVGGVSPFQVLFYMVVVGSLILWGKRISRQGCFKLIFVAISVLTIRVNFGAEIYFLDVGQGDGIFVQTATGKVYMIDGGSSSENDVGKYTLAPFLKSKGVRQIEAWIITHPDEDHCNGLQGVLEAGYEGRVERLLLPAVAEEARDGSFERLIELASTYEIPVYYLSAGMEWTEDGAWNTSQETKFLCLHPTKGYGSGYEGDAGGYGSEIEGIDVKDGYDGIVSEVSANEYSIVLYLEMGEASVLLTGDVEGQGELLLTEQLKQRGISRVDVLKVAHHGSKYSTLEGFLEVLDADAAVISCAKNNSYGHPHEELLERLEKEGMVVLSTPEHGAINVLPESNDGCIRIRVWSTD